MNEEFQKYLRGSLESQKADIESNGKTIPGIVDQQTMLSEKQHKRSMDVTDDKSRSLQLNIDGIRASKEQDFKKNCIFIRKYTVSFCTLLQF